MDRRAREAIELNQKERERAVIDRLLAGGTINDEEWWLIVGSGLTLKFCGFWPLIIRWRLCDAEREAARRAKP